MTEPTPLGLSQQAESTPQPDAAKGAAPLAADTATADALEAAATQRRRRLKIAGGVVLLIAVGLVIWRVFAGAARQHRRRQRTHRGRRLRRSLQNHWPDS